MHFSLEPVKPGERLLKEHLDSHKVSNESFRLSW